MKWDQIENKWTAMSRRMRPERCLQDANRALPVAASERSDTKSTVTPELTNAVATSAVRQDG